MKYSSLEQTNILDLLVYDQKRESIILAMFEIRPWTFNPPLQLYQLQEKINAYLSFILDGELNDTFPEFTNKNILIELRTVYEPLEEVFSFIYIINQQINFQNIQMDIVLIENLVENSHL